MSEELKPGPEDYRKSQQEMTPRILFVCLIGWLESMKENEKLAGGRYVYLEEGLVEGSCREGAAQGSAAWRINHRAMYHIGENMPTVAILRTGGERDTDGQRGGCRYPRDMIKEQCSMKSYSFSEIFWERT